MAIGREIKAMITLDDDVLNIRCPDVHPHAHVKLEFQRTLRIPDDDRVHQLPAGLGRFPLRHVEDFGGSLDEVTLRRGGIMMPMHRSEAMWINFNGSSPLSSEHAYPFAIKVAAGKINALTGEAWSPSLSAEEQDYIVIPAQPWIDGFAISKGIIRQFVAERLGEGFSVEEQLTGKAEFGGLQIFAYPMKAECYTAILRAREEEERAREAAERARERKRRIEEIRETLSPFFQFSEQARSATAASMVTLEQIERHLRRAVEFSSGDDLPEEYQIDAELIELLDRWNSQVAELANFPTQRLMRSGMSGTVIERHLSGFYSFNRSMGLGGGGRMRQEIYADPYGVDAWDQNAGSRCFVHLIDAAQWGEISGGVVPTDPPSQKDYKKNGLPWFDYYAPEKEAISGSKRLAKLKSWGSIFGEGHGAPKPKDGPAIQLGTAERLSGVVSEGASDE
jgi:hypothetical protein